MIHQEAVIDRSSGAIIRGRIKAARHLFGKGIKFFADLFVGNIESDGDCPCNTVASPFAGPSRLITASIALFEFHLCAPSVHMPYSRGMFADGPVLGQLRISNF